MCGWQPTATYMAAWSSLVARLAHNQEVVGSNPTVRNHSRQGDYQNPWDWSAVDCKQRSGLIHGFTLSTTTHSNDQSSFMRVLDMRYVAMRRKTTQK